MKTAQPSPSSPNVIVLLADDLGYGDLSCQGGKIQTPNLDKLAAEGIRFTDAHATSSVCTPSRYSLLTGRYNWRSRLKTGVMGGFDGPLIDSGRETLARFLKNQGYQTAAIGKWHLGLEWPRKRRTSPVCSGWDDPGNIDYQRPINGGPLDLGFDRFFGLAGSLNLPPFCFIEGNRTVGIPDVPFEPDDSFTEGCPAGTKVEGWQFETVDTRHLEEAEAFIKQRDPEQPFFLHFTPSAPHTPWLPPTFVRGKGGGGPRTDLICLIDWMVERLTNLLEAEGVAENTLFIVTSDNGALMPEIERERLGHLSNGELRGYKSTIFEGGHRVPFLVRWPQGIGGVGVCDRMVSLMDIYATVADILDTPVPRHAAEDSMSFLTLLKNPTSSRPVRDLLVTHSALGRFSIRRGGWKLIDACDHGGFGLKAWAKPDPGQPDGMLYNLDSDIQETENHWDKEPELVRSMLESLMAIRDGMPYGARASCPQYVDL